MNWIGRFKSASVETETKQTFLVLKEKSENKQTQLLLFKFKSVSTKFLNKINNKHHKHLFALFSQIREQEGSDLTTAKTRN